MIFFLGGNNYVDNIRVLVIGLVQPNFSVAKSLVLL